MDCVTVEPAPNTVVVDRMVAGKATTIVLPLLSVVVTVTVVYLVVVAAATVGVIDTVAVAVTVVC